MGRTLRVDRHSVAYDVADTRCRPRRAHSVADHAVASAREPVPLRHLAGYGRDSPNCPPMQDSAIKTRDLKPEQLPVYPAHRAGALAGVSGYRIGSGPTDKAPGNQAVLIGGSHSAGQRRPPWKRSGSDCEHGRFRKRVRGLRVRRSGRVPWLGFSAVLLLFVRVPSTSVGVTPREGSLKRRCVSRTTAAVALANRPDEALDRALGIGSVEVAGTSRLWVLVAICRADAAANAIVPYASRPAPPAIRARNCARRAGRVRATAFVAKASPARGRRDDRSPTTRSSRGWRG